MINRTKLLASAILAAAGALSASPAAAECNAPSSLDGQWKGSDGSTYFVRVNGNKVWWYGVMNQYPAMKSVFRGTLNGNLIEGEFSGLDAFASTGRAQVRTTGTTHMRRTDAGGPNMYWWREGCPTRPRIRVKPR